MRATTALALIGCATATKLIQLGPGDYPGAFNNTNTDTSLKLQVNYLGTAATPVANVDLPMVEFDYRGDARYKSNISVSLDDDSSLKLAMYAGAAKKFAVRDLSGEDYQRVRFEFQAKVECGDGSPYQEIRGTEFTPVFEYVDGSPAMPGYDAENSFVSLGRCDYCGTCQIFTRLQFTGTAADAFNGVEFTSVSWTASRSSLSKDGRAAMRGATPACSHSWLSSQGSLPA